MQYIWHTFHFTESYCSTLGDEFKIMTLVKSEPEQSSDSVKGTGSTKV